MKLNANNILQFIKNNKFVILGAFIILIILLNFKPIVEGLTNNIGQYDYLAPIPKDNKISDETLKAAVAKMNQLNCPDPSLNTCILIDLSGNEYNNRMNQFSHMATEAEWKYYASNGKFPYNGYVMTYIKNNPDKYPQSNLETIQRNQTNRMFYSINMYPNEMYENPKSYAYKIFVGVEDPSNPSSSQSQINTTYNDFVSVCKKAIGTK